MTGYSSCGSHGTPGTRGRRNRWVSQAAGTTNHQNVPKKASKWPNILSWQSKHATLSPNLISKLWFSNSKSLWTRYQPLLLTLWRIGIEPRGSETGFEEAGFKQLCNCGSLPPPRVHSLRGMFWWISRARTWRKESSLAHVCYDGKTGTEGELWDILNKSKHTNDPARYEWGRFNLIQSGKVNHWVAGKMMLVESRAMIYWGSVREQLPDFCGFKLINRGFRFEIWR